VKVTAGELGAWVAESARFEQINWVAPAGQLVYRTDAGERVVDVPTGHQIVGSVPNSGFPIHVNIGDLVTHNTAIIGVTGSGKSYLAFHLIEEIVDQGIKVLILDISRQHDVYLTHRAPTPLRAPSGLARDP
jgi:hypothetical protein